MPAILDSSDPTRRDRALAAAQVCVNKPVTWGPRDTEQATRETLRRWNSWWSRAELRFIDPSPFQNSVNIVANTQFGLWLNQFLTFDFGTSTKNNRPVIDILKERLPVTIQVSGLAIFFTYLIAIPLGIFSATHQDSFADRSLTLLLFLLYSIPVFWLAQMMILTMTGGHGWPELFPSRGMSSEGASAWPFWKWFLDRIWHLVLPVTAQTVVALAFLSRQMRVAMLETVRQDFIRTARAKGLRERVVVYKHAVRNSLIPVITLAADLLPALIGGSVIVEFIFGLNGMGKLTFEAILNRDYPVINCVFAFSALLTLVGILLADIGYAIVDPRIRYQ
jgi:peptide/nickel transport system permease protein